jgi:HSP20 family molecular chaperone IbpA
MARDPLTPMTGLAALAEISRRLGGLGDQIKGAVDMAQKMGAGAGDGSMSHVAEKRFSIPTPNGPAEGVTQMSFRVGSLSDRMSGARGGRNTPPSAASRAERPRKPSPDVDGAREPMVDCFEETDAVLVTAEMPGVAAAEIKVSVVDGALLIETTGERRYRAAQALPADVDPASLVFALRNGILEARLARTGAAA